MIQNNSNDKVEVRKVYYRSGALWRETPYVNGVKRGIEKWYEIATLNIVCLTLYDNYQRVASVKI